MGHVEVTLAISLSCLGLVDDLDINFKSASFVITVTMDITNVVPPNLPYLVIGV